jgi:hypothetical protein
MWLIQEKFFATIGNPRQFRIRFSIVAVMLSRAPQQAFPRSRLGTGDVGD